MKKKILAVFFVIILLIGTFARIEAAGEDETLVAQRIKGMENGVAFSHPGQNYPGATSWLLAYPELGQGVVIMTNGAKGDMLTLEIIPALAAVYGWPENK